MPYSMTGFARSEYKCDWGTLSCELKSVNHRYLDIYCRLPENLREFEISLRNQIKDRISRGKIECNIQLQTQAGENADQGVNIDAAKMIIGASEAISELIKNPAPIDPLEIFRMPGVTTHTTIDPEELKTALIAVVKDALDQQAQMRLREGTEMARVVEQRVESIGEQVELVKKVIPSIRETLRKKFFDRIEQLDLEVDPERLEQELIIQVQKMDVDEEIDRLEAHMNEVRLTLKQNKPIGRRLDFLMQELNREANTLGSKSQGIESTNVSIELKVLIEQMREQIQNIE